MKLYKAFISFRGAPFVPQNPLFLHFVIFKQQKIWDVMILQEWLTLEEFFQRYLGTFSCLSSKDKESRGVWWSELLIPSHLLELCQPLAKSVLAIKKEKHIYTQIHRYTHTSTQIYTTNTYAHTYTQIHMPNTHKYTSLIHTHSTHTNMYHKHIWTCIHTNTHIWYGLKDRCTSGTKMYTVLTLIISALKAYISADFISVWSLMSSSTTKRQLNILSLSILMY